METTDIPMTQKSSHVKALSVKIFMAQNAITEMEHPPSSPDLTPNDFWLLLKIKSALKGRRFQDTGDIKKCDDDTESCSTTGVPEMFPTVAGSIIGLSAQLLKGGTLKVTPLSKL
jgi:hypothetical protein